MARSFLTLNWEELFVELFEFALLFVCDSTDDWVWGVVGADVEDGELVEWSSANIVAISFCMKAQGTLEPRREHFSPDGQYTSPGPAAPLVACWACCLLIAALEQGKQNLCEVTDGHWTKWVSSKRSWQRVHFKGAEVDETGGVPVVGGEVFGDKWEAWLVLNPLLSNLTFLFDNVVDVEAVVVEVTVGEEVFKL